MVARAQSQELGSAPSPQQQEDKSKDTYSTSISQHGKLEGSRRNATAYAEFAGLRSQKVGGQILLNFMTFSLSVF